MRVVLFNKQKESYDVFEKVIQIRVDFVKVCRDYRVKCYILITDLGTYNLPFCEYDLHKIDI